MSDEGEITFEEQLALEAAEKQRQVDVKSDKVKVVLICAQHVMGVYVF